MGASRQCKVRKKICSSKSVGNKQNDDNYFLLWCTLARKNRVDNYRAKLIYYKKNYRF